MKTRGLHLFCICAGTSGIANFQIVSYTLGNNFLERVVWQVAVLRTILACLGASLLQFFSMLVVAVIGFMVELIGTSVILMSISHPDAHTRAMADVGGLLISTAVMLLAYAFVWYIFWVLNRGDDGRIRHFGWKLLLGFVPILVALFIWRPADPNDPTAMIIVYTPESYFFGLLVASLALFPLYAIGLQRYVFPKSNTGSIFGRLSALLGVLLVIGGVLYAGAAVVMPHLYKI